MDSFCSRMRTFHPHHQQQRRQRVTADHWGWIVVAVLVASAAALPLLASDDHPEYHHLSNLAAGDASHNNNNIGVPQTLQQQQRQQEQQQQNSVDSNTILLLQSDTRPAGWNQGVSSWAAANHDGSDSSSKWSNALAVGPHTRNGSHAASPKDESDTLEHLEVHGEAAQGHDRDPAQNNKKAGLLNDHDSHAEEQQQQKQKRQTDNSSSSSGIIQGTIASGSLNDTKSRGFHDDGGPSNASTIHTNHNNNNNNKHVAVDYASKSAGAMILDTSSSSFKGTSNLLQADRDIYAIVPCAEPTKYVVIGLSEDILVKEIVIANYERYSSPMKDIRFSGSATAVSSSSSNNNGNSMTTDPQQQQGSNNKNKWIDLGTYTTSMESSGGTHTFSLREPTWARYVKVEFLSHYGDEYYCTVSQISVHGATVLQGFHEQWGEEESNTTPPQQFTTKIPSNDVEDKVKNETEKKDVVHDGNPVESGEFQHELFERTGIALILHRCGKHSRSACPQIAALSEKMQLVASTDKSNMTVLPFVSHCRRSHIANTALGRASLKSKRLPGLVVTHSKRSTFAFNLRHKWHRTMPAAPTRATTFGEQITSFIGSLPAPFVATSITERFRQHLPQSLSNETYPKRSKSNASSKETVGDTAVASTTQVPNSTVIPTSDANVEVDSIKTDVANHQSKNVKKSNKTSQKSAVSDTDDLFATGLALANVLKRLPSANCLETLKFSDFKASASQTRSGSPNSGSGGSSGYTEPIFKKLTDEIKTLQSNVAVHDQFATETIQCYQRVMLDLLLEMESTRVSQQARLDKIESDLRLGALVVAIQKAIVALVSTLASRVNLWFNLFVLRVLGPMIGGVFSGSDPPSPTLVYRFFFLLVVPMLLGIVMVYRRVTFYSKCIHSMKQMP